MKWSEKCSRNDSTWVANAKFFLFVFFFSMIPSSLAELDPPVAVPSWLNSTLCEGRCVDNCKSYVTPLGQCFNGQSLFSGDPSWGVYDMNDAVLSNDSFRRQFFASKDGTCTGESTDFFLLPIRECVGPFGAPRPWGEFSFVDEDSPDEENLSRAGTVDLLM
jgi:hypothetical protein